MREVLDVLGFYFITFCMILGTAIVVNTIEDYNNWPPFQKDNP